MKKNYLYILLIAILVLILVISFIFLQKRNTEKKQNEIQVVSTTTIQEIKPLDPVMSEAEKSALGVSPTVKIEVLQRDSNGNPTAYKVIQ